MEPSIADSNSSNPFDHNPAIPNPADSAGPEPSFEKPICIELHQADKTRQGYFRPRAFLKVTSALRTSGLLLALPGEDLKNFLFLLSFLTPNGDCLPTVQQLAHAMHLSVMKVRSRMQRLLAFKWHGEPLVIFLHSDAGMDAYTINPRLVTYEHTQQPVPQPPEPVYKAAGREAVIAYSRQRYARPRAEVERTIAEQNGWPLPEEIAGEEAGTEEPGREKTGQEEAKRIAESQEAAIQEVADPATQQATAQETAPAYIPSSSQQRAYVKQRLLRLGMSTDIAEDLLERFDLVRIQRQLQWLRYRKAKNPAGFLIAAVEDNYEAPLALQSNPHQQRHQEQRHREERPTDGEVNTAEQVDTAEQANTAATSAANPSRDTKEAESPDALTQRP